MENDEEKRCRESCVIDGYSITSSYVSHEGRHKSKKLRPTPPFVPHYQIVSFQSKKTWKNSMNDIGSWENLGETHCLDGGDDNTRPPSLWLTVKTGGGVHIPTCNEPISVAPMGQVANGLPQSISRLEPHKTLGPEDMHCRQHLCDDDRPFQGAALPPPQSTEDERSAADSLPGVCRTDRKVFFPNKSGLGRCSKSRWTSAEDERLRSGVEAAGMEILESAYD